MKTDTQIIDDLIRREGDRYTNHPADRGGPTKYGITLATLRRYRRQEVTPADVEALTEAEARECYRDLYIVRSGLYRIADESLRAFCVDACVQHGEDDIVEWLQQSVGVKVDRDFGPKSAEAVNTRNLRDLFAELLAIRVEYYGELVTRDPKVKQAKDAGIRLQAKNALGWARRMREFILETSVL